MAPRRTALPLLALAALLGAALSGAEDGGPSPELRQRAAGYGEKRFDTGTLHPEDGYDEREAFAVLEFMLLGAIDVHRVPVQRYDRPILEGDAWRMDVHVSTPQGFAVEHLRLDRFTGVCRGGSWNGGSGTGTGATVDLGATTYAIEADGAGGYRIVLRHKRTSVRATGEEKRAATAECRRDARQALASLQRAFPGRFADVADDGIAVETVQVISEVGDERGTTQESLVATVPLRQR